MKFTPFSRRILLLVCFWIINIQISSSQECSISNIKFERTFCDTNYRFNLFIKFEYKNTGECFKAFWNDSLIGEYRYSQLPLKIENLKADCKTEYKIQIKDCHNENCTLVKEFDRFCCESDCSITEPKYEVSKCDSSNQFFAWINFKHQGPSNCFTVYQNSNKIGNYKYTDLPIKLGPFNGDCTTEYKLSVRDCHIDSCSYLFNLGKICCEQKDCKLSEPKMEKS
ncbi:MAG TPA: hypothetical protein PK006_13210, partial [Saprospiraceae bacterium]|nr:hypothetical protein [Saprospiraceae bacterium]